MNQKHHYIVSAIIAVHPNECMCPMGAVCEEGELNGILKNQGVRRYKMKSVDDEPIAGWEEKDWTMI